MIPSRIPGGTCIREGKDVLNLTDRDIDDRIINIRFDREDGRSFTIRSDYEPVFHADGGEGSIHFKKCVEKPDIKITYKNVPGNVAIEVNIEINNFSIGDAERESNQTMDFDGSGAVRSCTIQMGYRSQFPDWTKPEFKGEFEDFYALNNHTLALKDDESNEIKIPEEIPRNGLELKVMILTAQPKSYPPERCMFFQGIVGTVDTGLRWEHSEEALIKNYGDEKFPNFKSEIERVLFQLVSKRFISPRFEHRTVTIDDFTNLDSITATDLQRARRYTQKTRIKDRSDGKWKELGEFLKDGILTTEGAQKFGIVCTVSKTLRALTKKPPESPHYNIQHDTLGGQLTAIADHFEYLRWFVLNTGDLYFYHKKDQKSDLFSDMHVQEGRKKPIFLPAIYDLTPEGTRTIRCPFISFVSPLDTVLFESRFSIGTLVSFFYPVKTNAFLVIIADVEFATVQDINMMTLMCVDQPRVEIGKEEEPDDKDKNEDEDDTIEVGKDDLPDVVKSQLKRNQWYEQEIEIFKYTTQSPYALGGKDSMWFNVVHLKQKPEIDLKAWTEGQPTEAQILEAVMKWTRERHGEATWQKWMNRRSYFSNPDGGKSRENTAKQWPGMPDVLEGIGARNRVEVPWLYPEDVIIIRIPFRPEHLYDEKDKVTIKRR